MYKLNLQYDTYRLFKGEAGFETFKKCIAAKLIFDTELYQVETVVDSGFQ